MNGAIRRRKAGLLCLLLAASPGVLVGQAPPASGLYHERGRPDLINISTTSLGMDASNWSVVQDRRGLIHIGNTDGVLQHDGETWRVIHVPNYTPAFSLALGKDGRIYVGFAWGFGRIEQDEHGRDTLIVLSDKLPEDQQPREIMYETYALGDRVVFAGRTSERAAIYEWDGSSARRLVERNDIIRVVVADNRCFVQTSNDGLMELKGSRLNAVKGGELYRGTQNRIACMLPDGKGRLLVGAPQTGFHVYEEGMFVPAWTADKRGQIAADLRCGIRLDDGTYAFGTVNHGIWIVDGEGTVVTVLDAEEGLRDEYIVNLYQDRSHILWAALDNGMAEIAWPAPTTMFDRRSGLKGRIAAMIRFKGALYAATTQGLFRLVPRGRPSASSDKRMPRFEQVEGLYTGVLHLLDAGDEMLIAATSGFHAFDGKRMQRIHEEGFRVFLPLDSSRTRILAGSERGLDLLVRSHRGWSRHSAFPEISDMIISLSRSRDGRIWVGTFKSGAYAIQARDGIEGATVRHIEVTPGEDEYPVRITDVGGRIRLQTDVGNWIADPDTDSLWADTVSWRDFGYPRDQKLSRAKELSGWGYYLETMNNRRRHAIARSGADGVVRARFYTVFTNEIVHAVFAESDGVVWMGAEDFLFRHEIEKRPLPAPTFATLIRRVYRNDTTVYYWGNGIPAGNELTVPFGAAGVSVHYIVPAQMYPALSEYRWRLVGESNGWSAWLPKTTAEFPALSEGSYTFEVEARLVDGTLCDAARIRIRVVPPLYRTWWAYALYLIGASGLFVMALRFRTRRLEQRGRELEANIRERTVEIRQQSEKIQSQAEELETLDAIVRTVNKEVRLTDVLSALLQQTLLLFPYVSTAFYMQRSADDGMFRLVATVGEPAETISSRVFTLSEIMDDPSNSLQTIQDGVYMLRGLEKAWSGSGAGSPTLMKSFMGMSDVQQGMIRGFLVLGSDRMHQFDANDIRKLLRLREHVSSAVAKALAIRELESKNELLDKSNRQLRDMQQQLIVHEKLAALGELTAGIAHEIQNPLNFVNNFSSLSLELLDELEQDMSALTQEDSAPLIGLVSTVRSNCERIREHGMRATSIVRAMLMHTRKGGGRRETVSLNEFLDQFVMLSYHGMRMLHPEHDLRLQTEYDRGIVGVKLLPQEMSRVIVNICNNAWEAAIERADRETLPPAGIEDAGTRKPEVHVRSEAHGDRVRIVIRDNGEGIPEEMHGRIFEPFFTTKRSGNNAGLGLSMSYEIVTQLHQGTLGVRSEQGLYSEFIIDIPRDDVTRPD